MRDLRTQWSRTFNLMCEVALSMSALESPFQKSSTNIHVNGGKFTSQRNKVGIVCKCYTLEPIARLDEKHTWCDPESYYKEMRPRVFGVSENSSIRKVTTQQTIIQPHKRFYEIT